MPPPRSLRRLTDEIPALAVVVAVAGAHARFLALDGRPPRDLCNCQRALPRVGASLQTSLPDGLLDAAGVLLTPTGWFSMIRLGAVEILGRHPWVIQAFDLVSITAVVALGGWLARRWLGPREGLITTLLAAAMPALVVEGRQGWIHVPEAALVLGVVAVWSADTRLDRARSIAGIALLGALALMLRPSGLVWVGSLALVLWRVPWRRLLPVGVSWGVAASIPLAGLQEYLSAKAAARERYSIVIPDLLPQFLVLLGPAVSAGVALGLGLGVHALVRRRPGDRPGLALALTWVLMSMALAVVFRAGLDNHTLLLAGLAILGAWGLGVFPRAGLAVAVLAFAFQHLPQWAPRPGAAASWWSLPGAWRIQVAPSILNYYVPFPHYGVAEVRGLIDAICGDRPCTVAADQGLYLPYGEEPGNYELFAAGEDRVRLLAVHDLQVDRAPKLDALVFFDCPEQDRPWVVRWPDVPATREALVRRQHLEEVWATEVGPGCLVRWSTPDRFVAHPESLPGEPPR